MKWLSDWRRGWYYMLLSKRFARFKYTCVYLYTYSVLMYLTASYLNIYFLYDRMFIYRSDAHIICTKNKYCYWELYSWKFARVLNQIYFDIQMCHFLCVGGWWLLLYVTHIRNRVKCGNISCLSTLERRSLSIWIWKYWN